MQRQACRSGDCTSWKQLKWDRRAQSRYLSTGSWDWIRLEAWLFRTGSMEMQTPPPGTGLWCSYAMLPVLELLSALRKTED